MISMLATTQELNELFVVRNDDQLEVTLLLPILDDIDESTRERLDVVPI
jgi:hypothetical protein